MVNGDELITFIIQENESVDSTLLFILIMFYFIFWFWIILVIFKGKNLWSPLCNMQVQAVLLLLDGKETRNSVPTSDFPVQQNCRDIWVFYFEITLRLDMYQY